MGKITRAYNTQMGETGAGIHDAQSIDMSKKNEFTTKWGTYQHHNPLVCSNPQCYPSRDLCKVPLVL
jgi:hypothetical protein